MNGTSVDNPKTAAADCENADPYAVATYSLPTDPLFVDQWHLQNTGQLGGTPGIDLNVVDVWQDYDGTGLTVGVFDDSVQYTHPDLAANYDTTIDYDGADGDDDPSPALPDDDHGTAVAGIIAATANNGLGGAGVAYGATLAGFRGLGTLDNFQRQVNMDVSNNSWGYTTRFVDNSTSTDPFFVSRFGAVDDAVTNGRGGLGTVWVFAAGNARSFGGNANDHGFQNSRHTICVAAIDADGTYSSYSTPGAALLISGLGSPTSGGASIVTTDRTGADGYGPGDYTATFNGTSAAAPMISGVVALMLEANPDLGYRDVQEILALSARQNDAGSAGWAFNGASGWNGGGFHVSHDYGFGLADARAAVRLAETWDRQDTRANEQVVSGSNSTVEAIPDDGGGVSFVTQTIDIPVGLNIDYVEVELDVTHTWRGDLRVLLTSPDGTTSVLVDRPGDGGDAGHDVKFNLTSTHHRGETGAGTWTLQVQDHAALDLGTLNSWTLRLFGDALDGNDTHVYTDAFAGFAGDAARTTLSDSGGIDALNAAAVTGSLSIDLNAGASSTIAGTSLTIAAGTVIENAYGGDGNDTITGNDADNILQGGRGADVLNGGLGLDTATYRASTSAVTVDLSANTTSGGSAAGDTLSGIENVTGSRHGDSLTGDGGANVLTGGAGDDVLRGGAGADTLAGGAGRDTVTYAGAAAAVTVNLGTGTGTGGEAQGDSFTGIEVLIGTSFADSLTGDTNDNTLTGGLGADALDGGAGVDEANYAGSTAGVSVDLSAGTGAGGMAEGDTLSNIENLIGSNYDDLFVANGSANRLTGGYGRDGVSYAQSGSAVTIDLGAGTASGGDAAGDVLVSIENLVGSGFDDTLTGDSANNRLEGGAGGDTLDGGSGPMDYAVYSGSSAGVTVNLATGATSGGDAAGDTLISIEAVEGSAHNDHLTGNAFDNRLFGGGGDDVLSGGGDGSDIMDGGAGIDTATYENASVGIEADLLTRDGGFTEYLISIENLIGSAFDDELWGDNGDNTLTGGAGADILVGRGGADTLFGGAANDTLAGSDGNDMIFDGGGNDQVFGGAGDDVMYCNAGADALDGGTGIDEVIYSGCGVGVTVNLATGTGAGGDADGDTLTNIENLTGSNHGDTLTGNGEANVLSGSGGADTLNGGGGADTLLGGAAADTLWGGAGNDSLYDGGGNDHVFGEAGDDLLYSNSGANMLDGGADTDEVIYSGSGAGVTVNLVTGTGTGGDADGDTLANIENLTGSNHDDVLTGDGGANVLSGSGGADTLFGGGGADTLLGGAGNDTIFDGGGNDTVFAGGGDDVMYSNVGGDALDGNSGIDEVIYAGSGAGVTVNLATGTGTGGDADGDTLANIENLSGSNHADVLTGDDGANMLSGSGGADTLSGGGGADTLFGGAAADMLLGGAGNDTIFDGGGDDQVFGEAGDDVLYSNIGGDALDGGADTDEVNYSGSGAGVTVSLATGTGTGGDAQGDTLTDIENLTGSFHGDKLTGDGGANVLSGNGGADTLSGGGGDDTLIGGLGSDTLTGGAGNDAYIFGIGSGQDTVIGFEAGNGTEDTLDISAYGYTTLAEVLAVTTDDGLGNTRIQLDATNSVTLTGVVAADLHADDFAGFVSGLAAFAAPAMDGPGYGLKPPDPWEDITVPVA